MDRYKQEDDCDYVSAFSVSFRLWPRLAVAATDVSCNARPGGCIGWLGCRGDGTDTDSAFGIFKLGTSVVVSFGRELSIMHDDGDKHRSDCSGLELSFKVSLASAS